MALTVPPPLPTRACAGQALAPTTAPPTVTKESVQSFVNDVSNTVRGRCHPCPGLPCLHHFKLPDSVRRPALPCQQATTPLQYHRCPTSTHLFTCPRVCAHPSH